jgi:disintegrin/metalloproteinase domain-containing protein 28
MGLSLVTVVGAILAALWVAEASPTPISTQVLVQNFETVHPEILHQSRPTRNAHADRLDVRITTESGETFTLRLSLNDMVMSPRFSSVYYNEDGQEVQTEQEQVNCFYQGEVVEHPEWQVAMDSCQGLRGSFGNWANSTLRYVLEPMSQEDHSLEQPHSLSLEDGSAEGGQCGTSGHSHSEEASFDPSELVLDTELLERARRQSSPYYVELHIINDNAQFNYYGRNLERTVNRAISLINVADTFYRNRFNLRVVGLRAETWTSGDRFGAFSSRPEATLQQLRDYASTVRQRYDAVMLITGNEFSGSTIGIAYLNTMCGSASVGIVKDRHRAALATGSTFAHEMGHLFGMDHDSGACSCPDSLCIMAATINTFNPPQRWSTCSIDTYNSVVSRTYNNLARCLHNVPSDILGDPVCGDGILEEGEVCDCGSPQECTDPCCDARTCRLVAGAQCHKGECCNSQCRFKDSLSVCRPSAGQCDIEDYCTGLSSDCPVDVYVQDGTTCNNDQWYCFSGQCRTYNEQCQRHFLTNKGHDNCFSFNTAGSYFGNCGSDGTSYISCRPQDVMCGQLFCEPGGQYQNLVTSVYVVRVEAFDSNRRSVYCNTFTTYVDADILSPGLVEDGVKCGRNKWCYEQQCRNFSVTPCPRGPNGEICSGNGVSVSL